MTYLVDANVLSEPTTPAPRSAVVQWLREHESELAVDPIILGEIRFGILLLPKGARRKRLERWFAEGVEKIYCLPWTSATALRWAELLANLRASSHAMPVKDSLIAASALLHGFSVATRNVRDFQKTGVRVVDPFAE